MIEKKEINDFLFSLLVLMAFFTVSCNDKAESSNSSPIEFSELKEFDLKLIDTLRVKIGDSVDNTKPIYPTEIFGKLGLYTVHKFKGYAKIFYADGDTTFSVRYNSEGPNGIGKIGEYALILSEDSIYLTNKASQILRVDLNGNLLEKHQLQLGDSIMEVRSAWTLPLLKNRESLLMNITPVFHVASKEFHRMPLDGYFNLRTKEFKLNDNRYPYHYENGFYGINSYSYGRVLTNNNSLIYSFIYDPNFYNEFTESELSRYSGGDRIDEDAPFDESYRFLLGNEQYYQLIYDDKNDIIIRFKLGALTGDALSTDKWWDKPMKGMFYKGNRVASFDFPPSVYSRNGIFCKDGILYMPFHNKSNMEAEEGSYVYHLYQIKLNE